VLVVKTARLFTVTALAEIAGCYLPWLRLRKDGSVWLLLPAAASLALFAFLLSLHPAASGRIYTAYGGVTVATALAWLSIVDGVRLGLSDWIGAGLSLLGMAVIAAIGPSVVMDACQAAASSRRRTMTSISAIRLPRGGSGRWRRSTATWGISMSVLVSSTRKWSWWETLVSK